jgi:hypothetical protein
LLADYLLGQAMLDRQSEDSIREVDKLVMGVDRKLQQDIVNVKTDIEQFSKQQLSQTIPSQKKHYLLMVLLGALPLFIMALIGLIFASYYYGYNTKKAKQSSSSL